MSANSQVARNQSRQTFDSVYESTNPLTTIAGQRMVEWFSGNSLNTDRWSTNVHQSGTFAMANEVDGGFGMSTGTTNASYVQIYLNNKRPFSRAGCSCIWVAKSLTLSATGGFNEVGIGYELYNNGAWARATGADSNFYLRTARAESFTDVDTGMAKDVNWHTFKIDYASDGTATGGYASLSIDGILKVTSSAGLQSADRMQPVAYISYGNDGVDKTLSVRYCEAYSV